MLTIISQLGLLPVLGKLAAWVIEKTIDDAQERQRMQAAVNAGIKRLTQKKHTDVQDISDQWGTIKNAKQNDNQ